MNVAITRIADTWDSVVGQLDLQNPMAAFMDWVIGNDYPEYKADQWLHDSFARPADCAPIRRLTIAILQQAVADRASRIEFRTGMEEVDYPSCETFKEYEWRIERENLITNKNFAKIMAEAGVVRGETIVDHTQKLSVLFYFNDYPFVAMTVPANLLEPCMRTYAFDFNYRSCATIVRPENVVIVTTGGGQKAIAQIDHYDLASDLLMSVSLRGVSSFSPARYEQEP